MPQTPYNPRTKAEAMIKFDEAMRLMNEAVGQAYVVVGCESVVGKLIEGYNKAAEEALAAMIARLDGYRGD